uniref:hypothetical protein n=1 Tax=Gracilaria cliftonii TaxID=206548 RepID=UPI001D11092B|nr:hypothetical protein LKZ11_pgp124 [Gracilaria cliftonii]UAD84559.1 hypothetical protein [Gracilaria cliftonii]
MVKNLDLLPNKILNLYALESKISYLKKQKIIKNCTYNISNLPEGLIVHIKYSLHSNQIKYVYTQEYVNPLENNNLIFSSNISHFIKSFQYKYSRNLLNKLSLFKLTKFYILEFKYNLNLMKNLQIKLINSKTLPKVNIKLSFLTKMSNYINTYLSYIYHKFTYNYNYIQIINSNLYIKDISNLRLKTENLKLKLQYNLEDKINVIQKLIIQYKEKQLLSIYNYSYTGVNTNTHQSLYKISKLIRLKELYLLLILKYPAFKHLNLAKNSAIYVHLLFYYDTEIIKCMNSIINLYPYIILSYNRIFNLPLTLPNIYKNTIQFNIKAQIFDTTKNLITVESFNEKYRYANKRNKYSSKLINKTNYIFNMKYKIYPVKYIAIYLLISYTKNISHQILYLADIYKSKLIYKNYYQIGIGISLYSPFRQIPIVFMEYFTINKYDNILYIGTNFS